jgi:hypothetical protein
VAYDLRVAESKPGRTLVTPMNFVDVSVMTCANALCKCPHCYKVGPMLHHDTQKVHRSLFEEGLNSQI